MTAAAFGVAVAAFKDKAGTVGVVESHSGPFLKGVAYFALEFEIVVGHILGRGATRHEQ